MAAQPATQQAGGGPIPTPALQQIRVWPVPFSAAKAILERNHYLHSMPGGSHLAFGVFAGHHLLGALTFGAGPANVHRLVEGARRDDCMILSRLWLDDLLPKNSESKMIGVALRSLRRNTTVKFVVSYADPAAGHVGVIYQATGWLYTGLSQATPLFDIGDGVVRHSRSLSHSYGTHSTKHFAAHGATVRVIPQAPKHRYLRFLDSAWRPRLRVPVLRYPKREGSHARG